MDTNEPAFPQPLTPLGNPLCNEHGMDVAGLTKREWYAGKALQGIVSNARCDLADRGSIAMCSFNIADAMLAEAEKRKERT